jgi:hypothetical protein
MTKILLNIQINKLLINWNQKIKGKMKRPEVKREKNHKGKNKLSKHQILAIMLQILMHFIMIIVNCKIQGILIN